MHLRHSFLPRRGFDDAPSEMASIGQIRSRVPPLELRVGGIQRLFLDFVRTLVVGQLDRHLDPLLPLVPGAPTDTRTGPRRPHRTLRLGLAVLVPESRPAATRVTEGEDPPSGLLFHGLNPWVTRS